MKYNNMTKEVFDNLNTENYLECEKLRDKIYSHKKNDIKLISFFMTIYLYFDSIYTIK